MYTELLSERTTIYIITYLYHKVYIVHALKNNVYLHNVKQINWQHFASIL